MTKCYDIKNEALEKAIYYLRQYAAEDEVAGLNGSGCFNNPSAVVEEWVKEIKKLEKIEKETK